MPKLTYERPRGLDWGVDRVFACAVVPFLETGRRRLTRAEAELVTIVCCQPLTLTLPNFVAPPLNMAARFAALLQREPQEVGELVRRIGAWHAKQAKSKKGRARRVIEIAMTKRPGQVLSFNLLQKVAEQERIDLRDISDQYLRGRLSEIRKEVEAMRQSAPLINSSKKSRKLNPS